MTAPTAYTTDATDAEMVGMHVTLPNRLRGRIIRTLATYSFDYKTDVSYVLCDVEVDGHELRTSVARPPVRRLIK